MGLTEGQSDAAAARESPPNLPANHAKWVALLYAELRAMAQSELINERHGHTLSATALVNEVYLKLGKHGQQNALPPGPTNSAAEVPLAMPPSLLPLDRGTFFGHAAQAMRRILVDHARTRARTKRGGGVKIQGGDALQALPDAAGSAPRGAHAYTDLDPIDLDTALTKLAIEHDQAARVVELRFFAGLPEKTIAEVMGINERTVRRHWTFAKAWLAREMNPDGGSRPDSV